MQGSQLKKIIEAIRELVVDANLDCNDEGITMQVELEDPQPLTLELTDAISKIAETIFITLTSTDLPTSTVLPSAQKYYVVLLH